MKELEKVAVDNVINVQDEKGCERIRLNREYFTPFTPFIPCGTQMRHHLSIIRLSAVNQIPGFL